MKELSSQEYEIKEPHVVAVEWSSASFDQVVGSCWRLGLRSDIGLQAGQTLLRQQWSAKNSSAGASVWVNQHTSCSDDDVHG